MTVKQAINRIKKEIKETGYRENMCYPVFLKLRDSITDKPSPEQAKIEKEFWVQYYAL